MGRFLKSGQFTTLKDSITGAQDLPVGSTVQRSNSPLSGELRYNVDTLNLEYYVNSSTGWASLGREGTVETFKDSFVGDGSTSVFTMSSIPRVPESIFVFVGNVHQNPGVAYSTSGADITFSSPPPDSHTIVIIHGFDSTSALF